MTNEQKKIWPFPHFLISFFNPWYILLPKYPGNVLWYNERYKQMNTPEYFQKLREYCNSSLEDPIEGLNFSELIEWVHRHVTYTESELPAEAFGERRPELPLEILDKEGIDYYPYVGKTLGRCAEFTFLYNGLLLANGTQCRIIVDTSVWVSYPNKTTPGDHLWEEVFPDGTWVHVDPTEKLINKQEHYRIDWNKDVNRIWALNGTTIIDVTQRYRGENV